MAVEAWRFDGDDAMLPGNRWKMSTHLMRRFGTAVNPAAQTFGANGVVVQLEGETAEYDWIARPPDPWDAALPGRERDRNASLQALLDAMALREMLFCVLPGIRSAEFRAFRQSAREPPRVVIAGTVTREAPAVLRVPSPAMRAKLYGFHFCLDDGVLRPQSSEDRTLKLVTGE